MNMKQEDKTNPIEKEKETVEDISEEEINKGGTPIDDED